MPRSEAVRYSFNRGLISPRALARVDLKRAALSAEVMANWSPRRLGPMMLRPGWGYIGTSHVNAAARGIAFVASLDAAYLLEFTDGILRIWSDDALLTRAAVSTAVTNDAFDASLASWTDDDEAGGTSDWVIGGYMGLTGNGTAAAIRTQQVTVAVGDRGVEHALRVIIARGPVTLRVGTAAGLDDYINEIELGTGVHSLAFTPSAASFYIRFQSRLERQVLVTYCQVESAGTILFTSPYAAADLDYIRGDSDSQSVDVLFLACAGYTQRRIERRNSGRSWSIVLYQPDSGPFRSANVGPTTITASALSGNVTLTASTPIFRSTHAPSTNNGGALFKLVSEGQAVTTSITAQNTFTNAIRVTGVEDERRFAIDISGLTATGSTVTLQRSYTSDTGPWTDIVASTWTADVNTSFGDGLDNQILWYRIGIKTGDYGGGTTVPTLTFLSGSITGIARVTAYTSTTVVSAEVLTPFGSTAATDDWAEGRWSDYRGWPSAGTLYDGRLHWAGRDRYQGSESDKFDGFDSEAEGDAAPWDRSIGSGPLATINWLLPLERLVIGAQHAEFTLRSSNFDEPLTPTNVNCRATSTQGSGAVQAVKDDDRGFFVQRGGTRVFELQFNAEKLNYISRDMTLLNPDVCTPQVVRMAFQNQPDPRLTCVLSTGVLAMLVRDPAEEVMCWCNEESIAYDEDGEVVSTGVVEDIVELPGAVGAAEDRVYYLVRRTVNGSTVRYWEKRALESECVGGTLNKQADSFVEYSGAPVRDIPVAHLEGEEVIAWVLPAGATQAIDAGRFTVTGGVITLPAADYPGGVTDAVVGLHYRARWQSAKLGQALGKNKTIDHIAPVLADTHAQGLQVGQDFDLMDNLPLTYQSAPVDPDAIYSAYDEESQVMPGKWDHDARICLEANAPRPCTVLALVIAGQANG